MSKRRRATGKSTEDAVKGLLALGILAYGAIANWWNSIPPENRIVIIILATIIVVSSIGLIIVFSIYRKRERASAWRRAMAGWQNEAQATALVQKQSAIYMSDVDLEKFAAQVYKKMGYRVQHVGDIGDHGVDVLLINPKNQKEIVQCKQWNKAIGEPVVRELFGTMSHEGAARGWLWAPRGFSEPARKWAKGKSIELIDDQEIDRLIRLAFGKTN